jgi:UDP-N-acetyl-D-galactosamine dehydrogenase
MGPYIANLTVKRLLKMGKNLSETKILVMGATFKENVEDIRNSKVSDLIHELKSYSVQVDVVDPYANSHELMEEYGFELVEKHGNDYDAVVVAVSHNPYKDCDEAWFKGITKPQAILVDIKGMYINKIKDMVYISL